MYGHNPGVERPAGHAALHSGRQRLQHRRPRPAINYFEWCQDHNKPLQAAPFGDVAGGRPGDSARSEHLHQRRLVRRQPVSRAGCDRARAVGTHRQHHDARGRSGTHYCPANTQANPASERGLAFMWHSHNEREITTNNVFPGGMLMMMLVDSREFVIDESN